MFASVVIATFLLPNLAVLLFPFEQFPFSCAPMFAHRVSEDSPRYRFRFMAESPDVQQECEIGGRDLGLNNAHLGRYFFGTVYGSIDPDSPYGKHHHDNREAFEARLSVFFDNLVSVWECKRPASSPPATAIRLELALLDQENRDTEVRTVGRYDVAARRFVHTWRPQR